MHQTRRYRRGRRYRALENSMADTRSGQVVSVSHCLLNQNTRYLGGAVCCGVVSSTSTSRCAAAHPATTSSTRQTPSTPTRSPWHVATSRSRTSRALPRRGCDGSRRRADRGRAGRAGAAWRDRGPSVAAAASCRWPCPVWRKSRRWIVVPAVTPALVAGVLFLTSAHLDGGGSPAPPSRPHDRIGAG